MPPALSGNIIYGGKKEGQPMKHRLTIRGFIILAIICLFSPAGAGAVEITNTWTGAIDHDWSTPGNWDAGVVPASDHTVVIPGLLANYPEIHSPGTYTIEALKMDSGSELYIGSGLLSAPFLITNTLFMNGMIKANLGKIQVNYYASISGSIDLEGGSELIMAQSSDLTMEVSGQMEIAASTVRVNEYACLRNNGDITLNNGHILRDTSGSATPNINNYGTIHSKGASPNQIENCNLTIMQSGTLSLDSSNLTVEKDGVAAEFINYGLIQGNGTLTCTDLHLENRGIISPGFSLSGSEIGSITLNSNLVQPAGTIILQVDTDAATPSTDTITGINSFSGGVVEASLLTPGSCVNAGPLTAISYASRGGYPPAVFLSESCMSEMQDTSALSLSVSAAPSLVTYKWTGSVDSRWNNPGNWSPLAVPGAAGIVEIPPSPHNPKITDGAACNIDSLFISPNAELFIGENSTLTCGENVILEGFASVAGGSFTVGGSVQITGGELEIKAGMGSSSSALEITHSLLADASSQIRVKAGGSLSVKGLFSLAGDLSVQGETGVPAELHIDGPAVLRKQGHVRLSENGLFQFGPAIPLLLAVLGDADQQAVLQLSGGTLKLSGAAVLDNFGKIVWDGPAEISSIISAAVAAKIDNYGEIKISGVSVVHKLQDMIFHNYGDVTLSPDAILEAASGPALPPGFINGSGGKITGSGDIILKNGIQFLNRGIVIPGDPDGSIPVPGQIDVTGNYQQSSGGKLMVYAQNAASFSQLNINGNVVLDSTDSYLHAEATSNAAFTAGDFFSFLTCTGSISNDFATTELEPPAGLAFTLDASPPNSIDILVSEAIYTWTGAADSDWNNKTNWLNDNRPSAGGNVVIPGTPNNPSYDDTALNALKCVTVESSGILHIPSGAKLTMQCFTVTGKIDNDGTVIMAGDNADSLTGSIEQTGSFINSGEFVWNGGDIHMMASGRIENDGLFDIRNPGGDKLEITDLTPPGSPSSTAFANTGELRVNSAGGGKVVIGLSAFEHSGVFQAMSGEAIFGTNFRPDNRSFFYDDVEILSGASLMLAYGSHQFGQLASDTIILEGKGGAGGDLFWGEDPAVAGGPVTPLILLVGGIRTAADLHLFSIRDCSVPGEGGLQVDGRFEWSGGFLGNNGSSLPGLDLNGESRITGDRTKTLAAREMVNTGRMILEPGSFALIQNAALTNAINGVLEVNAPTDGTFVKLSSPDGSTADILNQGVLTGIGVLRFAQEDDGLGGFHNPPAFSNAGAVIIRPGDAASGTTGSLKLEIPNFDIGAGKLEVDITGSPSDANFDQFLIKDGPETPGGAASFTGSLHVNLNSGGTPPESGDRYPVMYIKDIQNPSLEFTNATLTVDGVSAVFSEYFVVEYPDTGPGWADLVYQGGRLNPVLTIFREGRGSVSGTCTNPSGSFINFTCPNKCSVAAGSDSTAEMSAFPDSGYYFDCWKVDGVLTPVSPGMPLMVSMTENHSVTAVFLPDAAATTTLNIMVSPHGAGTVYYPGGGQGTMQSCVSSCTEVLPTGGSMTLQASPSSGYRFSYWTYSKTCGASGSSTDNPLTLNIGQPEHNVVAIFTTINDPNPQYDLCPSDPYKLVPGKCGCGIPDTDSDGDGTPDCMDECPDNPDKSLEGVCGCDTPETDTDQDGVPDCKDLCPEDPEKAEPGACGCGNPETDTDQDGTPDCVDGCPEDGAKTAPGDCGCGLSDKDSDGDGKPDCKDLCPDDPNKSDPGACGCGAPDLDSDGDGAPDCKDRCPDDPGKTSPGACGCGTADTDADGDGVPDCLDGNSPGADHPAALAIIQYPPNKSFLTSTTLTITAKVFSGADLTRRFRVNWRWFQVDKKARIYWNEVDKYHYGGVIYHTISDLKSGMRYELSLRVFHPDTDKEVAGETIIFTVGSPEIIPGVSVPSGTKQQDFRLLTLPFWPRYDQLSRLLSTGVSGYDPRYFRIGTYDTASGRYIEYGPDLLTAPGGAIWFLARDGLESDISGVPISSTEPFHICLATTEGRNHGWNMIGLPAGGRMAWGQVQLIARDENEDLLFGPVPVSDLEENNPWISLYLWRWNDGAYESLHASDSNAMMEGNEGYWIKAYQNNISLIFSPDRQEPAMSLTRLGRRLWRRTFSPAAAQADGEDRPPAPPSSLTSDESHVSADAAARVDGGGGGCFLRSLAKGG